MCDALFHFSSKADTLSALSAYAEFHIPDIHPFTVAEWQSDDAVVIRGIDAAFPEENQLAVRSSCRRDDSEDGSRAGAYLLVLNVPVHDSHALRDAIDRVITSYGEALPDDQVLVQPMIANVAVSCVITTRAQCDGAPYYVIHYDDESGRTDMVTGRQNAAKTVYVYHEATNSDFDSARLRGFVGLARRVEAICGNDALDIEFCQDSESVMPDWNPAEMIGLAPRPLASSLYCDLITADVWREARKAMGYRPMPSCELMLLVIGCPYIDVRASFNSFLPDDLDQVTCAALVSAWLERLEAMPQLYDKVEFEVAQTVLDFSFDANMDGRYPGLLTSQRRDGFKECLRRLTNPCLDHSPVGSIAQAFETVTGLRNRQAGGKFGAVVSEIEGYLNSLGRETIDIPYTTRAWVARRKD